MTRKTRIFPRFAPLWLRVTPARSWCAYNAINGQPACAHQFLLQHTLRGAWQFQGYVVSDCGAVRDIESGHHYRPTQARASALSLQRGMDNECFGFDEVKDDHDYRPYIDAVQQGYL